jgi:hypothetical protein
MRSLRDVRVNLANRVSSHPAASQTRQGWLVAGFSALLLTYAPLVEARPSSTLRGDRLLLASGSASVPVAPEATAPGPLQTTAAEYRFPATVDPDVLDDRPTEIWAVVYRPVDFSGSPYPLLVFLHGNHPTCGTGENPRIDDNSQYTTTGTCPPNYVVVPNHRGYDYLAERLASWGYVVVSINANRGITAGEGVPGDDGLNLARGRLILKHLELLSTWNTTGGTPDSLGVDLRGQLAFNAVGLMGHSRGGEGVRAAYNLYRDPGSPWPTQIPEPVNFKGLFEFAPVDGQTDRILNADGVAWSVLLPQCDGDVFNLQGIKPFDRMLRIFNESPATQKSTFTVWGTNHNYYNTEWQESDSRGCLRHTPIFEPGPSVGSEPQRQTGLASLVPFMRGYVPGSVGFDAQFTQTFNPQFALPSSLTAITPINRGYTDSPNSAITAVLEDFDQPTGTSSAGIPNQAQGISIQHQTIREHDPSLQAGAISWSRSGRNVYFQTNVAQPNQGIDISAYKTLDLRLENNRFSETATDFEVALVSADNTLSQAVPISTYVQLVGPVGGPGGIHRMLQTARIPLTDLTTDLSQIRGVRLTFNKTSRGSIYAANIRLSSISGIQATSATGTTATQALGTSEAEEPMQPIVFTDGNRVMRMQAVAASRALRNQPGVEIEVISNQRFLARGELPVLRIGDRAFTLSRYPASGEQNRLIFTLTPEQFAQIKSGEDMWVQYGRSQARERWNFGRIQR